MQVNDLRPGTTFMYDNNIFLVVDQSFSKTGRQQGKVTVKVKNMRTGSRTEMTFTGGDKVDRAMIDRVDVQYLYSDGTEAWFMDVTSYEQFSIPLTNLVWEENFLIDGLTIKLTKYEDEILGVDLPDKVEMVVVEAEPAVKGDTTSSALKKGKTNTGLEIMLPLFIDEGTKILVSTNDGKYAGRIQN